MKDKKLREMLGISIYGDSVYTNEDSFIVGNYFQDCPCCEGRKYLLKDIAKSFSKRQHGYNTTLYTTESSYKIHLKQIKEWEKEVKKYKQQKHGKTTTRHN